MKSKRCVVIGAGPAGLTAAHELSKLGAHPVVLEQDKMVGGIARTVQHRGYRFDIGGHRFFSKVEFINSWWQSILGDDLLARSRLSRIYYEGAFFDYPLRPINALWKLGPVETLRIAASYIHAQVFPSPESSFEGWMCNRFGRRLFEIFFAAYTEKVWGMKCSDISADWASQRIKNLDLWAALKSAFLGNSSGQITTLIKEFRYPRLGPGMMWERVAQILVGRGVPLYLGQKVTKMHVVSGRIAAVTIIDMSGKESTIAGDNFVSSMPLKDLIAAITPAPPRDVVEASRQLRYRDFITIGLIVNKRDVFNDNWVYVHAPHVRVGRIQNFKNWSAEMVPDSSKTSLAFEYFVQEGDDLWNATDQSLIELATQECVQLGFIEMRDVIDGIVIRVPKAYPVYDREFKRNLARIREYLRTLPNLQVIGRNGQHRYNNQDHSMLTGIYAARNICGSDFDVWGVNLEPKYSESLRNNSSRISDRFFPEEISLA
jgi:protoporphyrinogen oxidase